MVCKAMERIRSETSRFRVARKAERVFWFREAAVRKHDKQTVEKHSGCLHVSVKTITMNSAMFKAS